MASHKVIQDIEAEDKFVGPLSLRQFVFAMIGAFFGYLNVFAMSKGATWAMLIFLPPAFFCFFLAVPWSKTQSTEVWFLAKLRFHFKPKRRVWNQSGLQELVTITAPKKIEKILTNNLSQDEVKSRLKALADTIDSRGWAVKHASAPAGSDSDRLIDPSTLPQVVPEEDLSNVPDVMDEQNTPVAANIEHLIEDKDKERKAELYEKMDRVRSKVAETDQPSLAIGLPSEEVPSFKPSSSEEQRLSAELHAKKAKANLSNRHMRSIPTTTAKKTKKQTLSTDDKKPQAGMTTPVRPDILELAQNNDLNVATIARQANKKDNENEVVVSLH